MNHLKSDEVFRDKQRIMRAFEFHDGNAIFELRRLLIVSEHLSDLDAIFKVNPRAVGYLWVLDGIRNRGWSVEYAEKARKTQDATVCLRIWAGLWQDLEGFPEWLEHILDALRETASQGKFGPQVWWPQLSLEDAREIWTYAMTYEAFQRIDIVRHFPSKAHLSAAPSAAIEQADPHARIILETLQDWRHTPKD